MKRRLILVITIVVLGLGVGVGVTLYKQKQSDNKSVNTERPVKVQSAESIASKFSDSQYEDIKNAIEARIESNTPDAKGEYEINYREGSYTESNKDGLLFRRALFDVPKLERSFVVEAEGDSNSNYGDLRILCPKPNELVYKLQECNDTP